MDNKVLFVTYYWPPSGGAGVQRILKFIKYLPEFDLDPVVLTVENPTYTIIDETLEHNIPEGISIYKSHSLEPFQLYATLTNKNVAEVAKPTTTLARGKHLSQRVASWIRANVLIPDARAGWLVTARSKALNIARLHSIGTVVTSGPPHSTHFVGRYLKRKLGLRWIADFRDPWSEVYYNQLLPRTWLTKKLDKVLEKSVLKNADEVLVVSPTMGKTEEHIYPRTYRVITNGFDHEDFSGMAPLQEEPNPVFTIRHVGSIGESSVPYGLFRALADLPDKRPWKLEFIGNVHPSVLTLIDQYSLNNRVVVRSYLPHAEAIGAMRSSDLLLLIIPDTNQNRLILTGKLFEYIGSGRPVMLIGPRDGDACSILDEVGNAWCFEHNETDLQKRFLRDRIDSHRPGGNNRQIELEDLKHHPYSRYMITGKLAQLVNM